MMSDLSANPARAHDETALVRFINVQKSYGGLGLVVKNLNLDVLRGEFLTLLGPSGSGKTTTLMMLAGFQDATSGEILLDGRPVTQTPPHERGIGMVFQSYALFPHMTVAQNLAFPLEVRRVAKADIANRVKRALEMVELPNFAGRRPSQLSGGQQQRVALARALIFEPTVVLMDEPLGALDKHLREQMQYEIKALHDRLGITMIYVTHDQSEALTMSDRIAVFNDGIIQQLSTPQDLYERPANAFVARFIGENNTLTGKVAKSGKDGLYDVALSGGGVVRAVADESLAPGDSVIISVRPERCLLGHDFPDPMNQFDGKVLDTIYHGDHIRVKVHAAGSENFIIKTVNARSDLPLRPGVDVKIGWDPKDCRAFR